LIATGEAADTPSYTRTPEDLRDIALKQAAFAVKQRQSQDIQLRQLMLALSIDVSACVLAQTESGADAAAALAAEQEELEKRVAAEREELEKRAVEGKEEIEKRAVEGKEKRERVLKKKWLDVLVNLRTEKALSLAGTIHPRLNEHQALMLREILADVRPDAKALVDKLKSLGVRSIADLPNVQKVLSAEEVDEVLKTVRDGCVTKYCVPCHPVGKPFGEHFLQGVMELCVRAEGPELQAPWTSSYPLDLASEPGTLTNVLQHRALTTGAETVVVRVNMGHSEGVLFFRLEHAVDDTQAPLPKVGSVLSAFCDSDRSPELLADFIKEVLSVLKLERRDGAQVLAIKTPDNLPTHDRGVIAALCIALMVRGSDKLPDGVSQLLDTGSEQLPEGMFNRMDTYRAVLHALLYTCHDATYDDVCGNPQ
jgi:hypothetical protein